MEKIKIDSPILKVLAVIPLDSGHKESIIANPSLLDGFFESPVNFISWSVRTNNVFSNKYGRVKDIVEDLDHLIDLKNFGALSYEEVRQKLAKYLKKYICSENYRNNIKRITDELNSNKKCKLLNKGILGFVCNDRIHDFSKIILDKEKFNKFLNTSIHSIEWSVRTTNVLKKANIKKIRDLKKFEAEDLMQMENFGRKCLAELYSNLGDFLKEFKTEEEKKAKIIRDLYKVVPSCDLVKLIEFMLSKISAREKKIICKRYGLWNGERKSLAGISKGISVTRERIRQLQVATIKKLHKFFIVNHLDIFLKDFFDVKLLPFLERNFNVANISELVNIIYSLDGENIEVDIANEFLSEVFFEEKPIFSNYVIRFNEETIGLFKDDQKIFFGVSKIVKEYLTQKGMPQTLEELLGYFERSELLRDLGIDREKLKRFILLSDIARDSEGNFGIKEWEFFNSYSIPSMVERALRKIGKPAHFTQIALLIDDIFPHASCSSKSVHNALGWKKKTFIWVAPGIYGLKEWGLERPPYIKDYLVELLRKAKEPLHINKLTKNVLKKCNCSKASILLTLNFNKDAFLKYPDSFYGLTKWK